MIRNSAFIRLCRARDWLHEGHAGALSVADAAREAHLSPCHFIRAFRLAFGETPHEFRTRVRIERAKRLLAVGDQSVTDLCLDLGYSSVGSFSSLFMRHTGVPPSVYRRQLRAMVQVPGRFPRGLVPYFSAAMYATHARG